MLSPTPPHDPLLQPALDLMAQQFRERLVRLPSGAQVALRECGVRGASPSVVLLHGISSGAASWLHTATRLAGDRHVLAWDAPGYGASSPLDDSAPRDADYAARLHQLLQALQIDRCVLVGHSLGALMAAAYVREHGAAGVARLVLISPASGYGTQPQAAARVRRERADALAAQGVAGLAEKIPARLLSPAASESARAWVRWNTARLHAAGYLQAVELLCASDLGASPLAQVPLAVHCGDADVVTPPASCRSWAERFGAPFALIEGAGHASPAEQPEAVAGLIRAASAP